MKPVSEALTGPIGNIKAARALLRAGMTLEGLLLLDEAMDQLLCVKAEHLAAEAAADGQK